MMGARNMKSNIIFCCSIGLVTLFCVMAYSKIVRNKLPWVHDSGLYWKFRSQFVIESEIKSENTTVLPTDKQSHNSTTNNISPKHYKIIFWGSVPAWLPKVNFSSCQFNRCSVSGNKNYKDDSDAVIFHGPRYSTPIPQKQKSQVWIFMSFESPRNSGSFRHFNNKINWTWSYRRDSDIVRIVSDMDVKSLKEEFNILPKKKQFAWFASNCNDRSKRIKYVEMMKKYTPVDVYGRCGQLKCNRGNDQCLDLLRSTYNFYLSFENSKCRDYITEKALDRIHNSIVPVTRGGANYSLYLPPHSYIDTSWYESVQAMIQAVVQLGQNKSIYSKFHKWRQYYTKSNNLDLATSWCEICKRLHFQNEYKRLYSDIQSWWNGNNETGYICSDANDIK